MAKYYILTTIDLGAFVGHNVPKEVKNVARLPKPVVYDRKRKINNEDYKVIDWAKKAHEEIDEALECGTAAKILREQNAFGSADMYDTLENAELFDALTVVVSRLASKGIFPGSEKWNSYVDATDKKNEQRGAHVKHGGKNGMA